MSVEGVLAGIAGNCEHYWIPNSGQGGEPVFRPNRQMSTEPLMHFMCARCKCRTWFTEKQWNEIPATVTPSDIQQEQPKGEP